MLIRTYLALLLSLVVPIVSAGPVHAAAPDFPVPSVTFDGAADATAMMAPVSLGHHVRAWHPDFATHEPLTSPTQSRVMWGSPAFVVPPVDSQAQAEAQAPRPRPVAIQYSNAYAVRAKIHRWASVATLPLFGAQAILGVKLDEGTTSEAVRATHAGIATSMVALFGVNSVTGLWNLWDARKDPNGRKKRLTHSLLMLGSDAGFVATGLLAPTNDGGGNRGLHKTVAISSIGVATAGYLLMLLTH